MSGERPISNDDSRRDLERRGLNPEDIDAPYRRVENPDRFAFTSLEEYSLKLLPGLRNIRLFGQGNGLVVGTLDDGNNEVTIHLGVVSQGRAYTMLTPLSPLYGFDFIDIEGE